MGALRLQVEPSLSTPSLNSSSNVSALANVMDWVATLFILRLSVFRLEPNVFRRDG